MAKWKVDAVIAGAQRCATTSLYAGLLRHPDIYGPAGKETHFFDQGWIEHGQDLSVYQYLVAPQTPLSQKNACFIEATPVYCFYPPALKRLAQSYPDVKIIFCLRDPVNRAYSHFWHAKSGGSFVNRHHLRLTTFDAAMRTSQLFARARRSAMVGGIEMPASQWITMSFFDRGYYLDQLARILDYFPTQNILVLRFEDMTSDMGATICKVHRFLGVEPKHPPRELHPYNRLSYPSLSKDAYKYWSRPYSGHRVDDIIEIAENAGCFT